MIKKIIISILLITALVSCSTSIKTTSKGKDNVSYLEFIGDKDKYKDQVSVTLDGNIKFEAVINNKDRRVDDGTNYQIEPGKHSIEVVYNNELVFKKQIFLSPGETKQILIP